MKSVLYSIKNNFALLIIVSLGIQFTAFAQFKNLWMNAGSLHSWYSEIGSELEEGGPVRRQQYGMQWL